MLTICLTFSAIWAFLRLRLIKIQQMFAYYTNVSVGITVAAAFSAYKLFLPLFASKTLFNYSSLLHYFPAALSTVDWWFLLLFLSCYFVHILCGSSSSCIFRYLVVLLFTYFLSSLFACGIFLLFSTSFTWRIHTNTVCGTSSFTFSAGTSILVFSKRTWACR